MKNVGVKTHAVLAALTAAFLVSGCTDWKKKYDGLLVEHENMKGLYDNCIASLDTSVTRADDATRRANAAQLELEELKKQLGAGGPGPLGPWPTVIDERRGTITVTLPDTILFASGKADLKSSTSSELDQIAAELKKNYASKDVSVVGHTDTDPINKTKDLWKDNWDLSSARALSVLRYLVKKGIQPNRIKAVAAGEFREVASNSTAAGKQKNRRVEIVVHMY